MTFIHKGAALDADGCKTYLDLANGVSREYDSTIILVKVGERLIELNKTIDPDDNGKKITFITVKDPDGYRTYQRGATMMFLRAAARVMKGKVRSVKLEYSIGDALFFSIEAPDGRIINLSDGEMSELLATMRGYAERDEKFEKSKYRTDDITAVFHEFGMADKERLFHYRRSSTTNVYRFGKYIDYYYGYMPPSAGYIKIFDLERIEEGILLVLPKITSPGKPGSKEIPKKLFRTMYGTNIWGKNIGVPTVGALNDAIVHGRGSEIILASEAYQEHKIGEIARQIKEENRRIVMIAGPSSSGKTSFSHRLSIQLGNVGLRAHPIAIDDYYVERSRTPRDENGEYDFECLEAIDIELFNDQMCALLRGETVDMPNFNFKTGRPEYNGRRMKINAEEVLVIEGIHGLNDKLSYAISPDDKYKVYISAVTALNIDEHNRIPTTDNREIRRMVRDARTRGFSAVDTISRWQSVRRGEERHIFPFQEMADVMFNSASLYELAVLKIFAEPLLFAIPHDAPEYPEAKRLLKFLEYFLGLSCEDVPRNSLVREFIGGSIFPVG